MDSSPDHQDSRIKHLFQGFQSQASAFSYLLFILLYTPCISAIATLVREFGYKWALASSLWTLYLAYAVSIVVYQSLTLLEHPLPSLCWIAFFS